MSKLSKKELAALDLLIAHIEENGDTTDLNLIGAAVNFASLGISQITNLAYAISNPSMANVVGVIGGRGLISPDLIGGSAAVGASGHVNNATVGGQIGAGVNLSGLVQPQPGENPIKIDSEATLKDLVELRKSNS